MYHILIVEDDLALAQGLCRALSSKEILTEYRGTLREARAYLKENVCTMVLLDVNLPDGSGFDFLKEIKETGNVQVILLTVNDLETDIVTGLELGAEDYITKPFSVPILIRKIAAVLRRSSRAQEEGHKTIAYQNLSLDLDNYTATLDGLLFPDRQA